MVEVPIPMNMPRLSRLAALAAALCAAIPLSPVARAAEGDEVIVSVASRAWRGYVRTKLPDGTFEPETFAFGNGGKMTGAIVDDTLDKLSFMQIASLVAKPLAERRYLPATDAAKTNLLIMIYWGVTTGTNDPSVSATYDIAQSSQGLNPVPPPPPPRGTQQANRGAPSNTQTIDAMDLASTALANQQRDSADTKNAMLLGYDSELAATAGLENTPLKGTREALIADLEDNRYFVILMAYDFQLMWKEKKHKLLWETRISLRERGNDFRKGLPEMLSRAERYIGGDTDGLAREPIPVGRVEIGVPKVIESPETK
jgi:hypothetical protein